jgi:ABC-type lipoprotein release transport system permease subunit
MPMQPAGLVLRSLTYYWRTNLAVVLGVATAVAVLAGALLVGDSVRGSLRDLVVQRLGQTDEVVVSSGFFREALAGDLRADESFAGSFASICPVIVVQGLVSDQASGRRASRVLVYGVDDRFWQFHGAMAPVRQDPSALGEAAMSAALASEIGAAIGGAVLLRVERPSAVPIESLHGRKDDIGRSMRLTVGAILGPAQLGEFSLSPQQGRVLAVFVPLERLQQELDLDGRVNTLLVSEPPAGSIHPAGRTPASLLEQLVRKRAALEDSGLTVRVVPSDAPLILSPSKDERLAQDRPVEPASGGGAFRPALSVEASGGLLDQPRAAAAEQAAAAMSMQAQPVFTYLVNTMRAGNREVPYSLVTATDLQTIVPSDVSQGPSTARPEPVDSPIILNDWAARDLEVRPGDPLTLEYYVWEEPGRLVTHSTDFHVAAVVPIAGAAADRDLAPRFPGISDSDTLADWDPPFPLDLRRVRPADEEYWRRYRTTPKAFIPLEVGQRLWRSRYGDRTSVRIAADAGGSPADSLYRYTAHLRTLIDPLALGLSVRDVAREGVAASRGATDFGEYFTYFSFFLVVSALLLTALFFRLGVEQRAREVGLLRAVGYTTPRIQRFFFLEGLLLAAIGGLIGIAGAIVYAAAMMAGLGSWWAGAVGTDALRLHVSPASLGAGVAGAGAAAAACIWWTMRGLSRMTERSLLSGNLSGNERVPASRRRTFRSPLAGALAFGALGAALMIGAAAGAIDRTGAFFGAGSALLVSCLCAIAFTLRVPERRPLTGHGWWAVSRLGLRNAAVRPGRSVLAIAVIAAASFILISVDAFRRPTPAATDRHSGVGGYSLMVELLVPLAHDPNGRDGRELLGIQTGLDEAAIEPFRLRPGDDASCLNLYEPRNPRILGAGRGFIESGRFAFQSSVATSDAERLNPWLLLNKSIAGEDARVVPVIADANSMTYVLHKALGDDIVINQDGRPVRLRLVAALADSIFQSELIMSDTNFRTLFAGHDGYRLLLVDAPPERAAGVASALEKGGRDLGADVVSTVERLAEFHRVENTFISTFQTLGGLGLLVGTVGMAAVLFRNVLERRRDLALLGAVGYRKGHVFTVVLVESVLLLAWGLAIGTVCALVAVAPAFAERGGRLPITAGGGWLLVSVFLAGLIASILATSAALRAPLLSALRSE